MRESTRRIITRGNSSKNVGSKSKRKRTDECEDEEMEASAHVAQDDREVINNQNVSYGCIQTKLREHLAGIKGIIGEMNEVIGKEFLQDYFHGVFKEHDDVLQKIEVKIENMHGVLKNERRSLWSSLPYEVMKQFFEYLPMRDVGRAGMVCLRWYNLITKDEEFWKHRLVQDWGESLPSSLAASTISSSSSIDNDNDNSTNSIASTVSWRALYIQRCTAHKNWLTGNFTIAVPAPFPKTSRLLTFSISDRYVASYASGKIRIWDTVSNSVKVLQTPRGYTPTDLHLTQDNKWLYSTDGSEMIMVWSIEYPEDVAQKVLVSMDSMAQPLNSRFFVDDQHLLMTTQDQSKLVIATVGNPPGHTITHSREEASSGKKVVKNICRTILPEIILDLKELEAAELSANTMSPFYRRFFGRLALQPGQTLPRVLVMYDNRYIMLIDLSTKSLVKLLPPPKIGNMPGGLCAYDGKYIVTSKKPCKAILWDATTGNKIRSLEVVDDINFDTTKLFAHCGLLIYNQGKTLFVTDIHTGKHVQTLHLKVNVYDFYADQLKIVVVTTRTLMIFERKEGNHNSSISSSSSSNNKKKKNKNTSKKRATKKKRLASRDDIDEDHDDDDDDDDDYDENNSSSRNNNNEETKSSNDSFHCYHFELVRTERLETMNTKAYIDWRRLFTTNLMIKMYNFLPPSSSPSSSSSSS